MPSIIKVKDSEKNIKTENFPSYSKFGLKEFNPVQSKIFELYDKDINMVIAAKTGSGKTVCAEMFISHEINVNKNKVIYLAPLKALAKEKIDDWTEEGHHLSEKKLSICTGDFRLTPDRKKELESSDIILMTSEMLNSRTRNFKSENNEWLKKCKLIIVDESHLLTVCGRGDDLEIGLINFINLSPDARIVFLSATMPNVDEISEWLSYSLNKKQTYLLESNYRPCPLNIHYETYIDDGSYDDKQENIINEAMILIEKYPDDRFLLFVHTKKTGALLKKKMVNEGYDVEFHSADLDKNKRHSLEKKFRNKKLQYVIATSTLAWGCNLPARRVIILGIHRGLQEVPTYDIWQMVGRAGRPGYDPEGDAYIILPDSQEAKYRNYLNKPQKIISRLLDTVNSHYKNMAFHIVSEIHHRRIKSKEDVYKWYEKTLARFQNNDLDNNIVESTIDLLLKYSIIKEEGKEYKVTSVGMISSMFYYSPFDVADLRRNFINLFYKNKENDNLYISLSLSNIDSNKIGICNKNEKQEIYTFKKTVENKFGKDVFTDSVLKNAYCYYSVLTNNNLVFLDPCLRTLQYDFPRMTEVLNGIDSLGTKWGKKEFFRNLNSMITYGVRPELLNLITIPGIGKVRAEKLYAAGIKNCQDIIFCKERVKSILNVNDEKLKEIFSFSENENLKKTINIE